MRWSYRQSGHRAEDGQGVVEVLDGVGTPCGVVGDGQLEWLAGARSWRIINVKEFGFDAGLGESYLRVLKKRVEGFQEDAV